MPKRIASKALYEHLCSETTVVLGGLTVSRFAAKAVATALSLAEELKPDLSKELDARRRKMEEGIDHLSGAPRFPATICYLGGVQLLLLWPETEGSWFLFGMVCCIP